MGYLEVILVISWGYSGDILGVLWHVCMLGLANLKAQTSSYMPLGGLVLKRSGMEGISWGYLRDIYEDILGISWGYLGDILGGLGDILGVSWGNHGEIMGIS